MLFVAVHLAIVGSELTEHQADQFATRGVAQLATKPLPAALLCSVLCHHLIIHLIGLSAAHFRGPGCCSSSSAFVEEYCSLVSVWDGVHSCRWCTYATTKKSRMRRHLCKHTGKHPFLCHLYPAMFNESCNLNIHKRMHTGERPFTCVHCTSTFTKKGHLVRHMRIHTGDHSYHCHLCPALFFQKTSLVHHIRTHTGKRPFPCDYCDASFRLKQQLIDQMRSSHTKECPFSCAQCNTPFPQQLELVRHRCADTREHPFLCKLCGKSFTLKQDAQLPHVQLSSQKGALKFCLM
ncbi:hypothetical protein HPB51_022497 [Rhipicephalus microplus]|uniref:C2H2-type domain-containing protein n=1 Tax=Rhipicephalus microplus TaxID=6941 RepID=A0A9J6ECQ2_RHIMP|nr:hypothetical protein HPB51_022497 [Rhipicephalus microplus]